MLDNTDNFMQIAGVKAHHTKLQSNIGMFNSQIFTMTLRKKNFFVTELLFVGLGGIGANPNATLTHICSKLVLACVICNKTNFQKLQWWTLLLQMVTLILFFQDNIEMDDFYDDDDCYDMEDEEEDEDQVTVVNLCQTLKI